MYTAMVSCARARLPLLPLSPSHTRSFSFYLSISISISIYIYLSNRYSIYGCIFLVLMLLLGCMELAEQKKLQMSLSVLALTCLAIMFTCVAVAFVQVSRR